MLSVQDTVKEINSLIKLNIDEVSAYARAIPEIDKPDIRERLIQHKNDHERHIKMLSKLVRDYGETPAEYQKDMKGFFIEAFTRIASKVGTKAALRAMRGNEKLTNSTYKASLLWDVDEPTKKLLQQNCMDEELHLAYIEEILNKRTPGTDRTSPVGQK
jgi:rubrerythrin